MAEVPRATQNAYGRSCRFYAFPAQPRHSTSLPLAFPPFDLSLPPTSLFPRSAQQATRASVHPPAPAHSLPLSFSVARRLRLVISLSHSLSLAGSGACHLSLSFSGARRSRSGHLSLPLFLCCSSAPSPAISLSLSFFDARWLRLRPSLSPSLSLSVVSSDHLSLPVFLCSSPTPSPVISLSLSFSVPHRRRLWPSLSPSLSLSLAGDCSGHLSPSLSLSLTDSGSGSGYLSTSFLSLSLPATLPRASPFASSPISFSSPLPPLLPLRPLSVVRRPILPCEEPPDHRHPCFSLPAARRPAFPPSEFSLSST